MSYGEHIELQNEDDSAIEQFGWMYEDELPEDMTDAEYAEWFRKSWVDGVRMGPLFSRSYKPTPFPPFVKAVGCSLPDLRYVIYGSIVAAGALLAIGWLVRKTVKLISQKGINGRTNENHPNT